MFRSRLYLKGHVNGWTSAPELSVRWWNQRNADYGAGFMMMMYLVDQLGGGPAMRQLVQDSSTGGVGVRNLAIAPPNGQGGKIGSNMNDVFANFSIAATLDSDQGIYGYANLTFETLALVLFSVRLNLLRLIPIGQLLILQQVIKPKHGEFARSSSHQEVLHQHP